MHTGVGKKMHIAHNPIYVIFKTLYYVRPNSTYKQLQTHTLIAAETHPMPNAFLRAILWLIWIMCDPTHHLRC